MIDIHAKSLAGLDTSVANHVRRSARDSALYRDAVGETARRGGKTLDPERTRETTREAAMVEQVLSYTDIADASGAEWNRVRPQMTKHLGDIVRDEAERLGFMVSAIIVATDHRIDGSMDPKTLNGFLTTAECCQLLSGKIDGAAFLKRQRARVFARGGQGAPM